MPSKLQDLKSKFKELGSAVIAFSGGVDSAVLVKTAHDVLGGKMLAVTCNSHSVPSRDLNSALSFCKKRNIPHRVIETSEFANETYLTNPENRCFYCKSEIFNNLSKIAKETGLKYIIEGTNASEILGHRPGFEAKKNLPNVVTPFVDLNITKDEIREMARELDLEVAERPSTACLSSRIPTGVRLEPNLLKRIDEAENFILSLGIKQVRIRHHDNLARLEVGSDDILKCVEMRDCIVKKVRELGWKNVTLDLAGYRTGGGM